MRFSRRAAVVLVVALLAVVVAALTQAAPRLGEAGVAAAGDGAALTARQDGVQAAAVRLERDQRRDAVGSQRSVKYLLGFAVLLAALFALLGAGLRRLGVDSFRPSVAARWFRSGGRAPPRLQPSFT